jgi:hypothetical protein
MQSRIETVTLLQRQIASLEKELDRRANLIAQLADRRYPPGVGAPVTDLGAQRPKAA